MTLVDALAEAAAATDAVERRDAAGGSEWLVGGRPFAAVSHDAAEFRLPRTIARAALGTPDTGASARGSEWVSFAPRELDRFALDRAVAWFASALRHASPTG